MEDEEDALEDEIFGYPAQVEEPRVVNPKKNNSDEDLRTHGMDSVGQLVSIIIGSSIQSSVLM